MNTTLLFPPALWSSTERDSEHMLFPAYRTHYRVLIKTHQSLTQPAAETKTGSGTLIEFGAAVRFPLIFLLHSCHVEDRAVAEQGWDMTGEWP